MSLTLNNVSKHFDNSDEDTIHDINLTINDGDFVCVVGKSGCGKSTLLNLIAGLDVPTSGEILLDGNKINGPGPDRTVLFQEHALFPWLNVYENVIFGMKITGKQEEEQKEKADYFLEMVGLSEYKNYRIHQLSGGMKQRVALARALTMDSRILLMDEPFSALDKQTSNSLREELQKIWIKTHKTIFFITHSVEEAVYLASRIVVLSLNTGTISDVINIELERPRHVSSPEFMELRHDILKMVRGTDDY